jgi:hypothetical protein
MGFAGWYGEKAAPGTVGGKIPTAFARPRIPHAGKYTNDSASASAGNRVN